MAELRPYQFKAMEAISADLDVPGASIIVAPTGSGKSHVIAAAALLRRPVLILQPSVELVTQNREKLAMLVPENEIGVYSASFGTKDIKTFTFATIQSCYKHADLFKGFQLVILDECHLLAPRNLNGMFTSFLSQLPGVKVFGFTATPFRAETVYEYQGKELYAATGIKMINRMHVKGTGKPFWSRIINVTSYQELLKDGYLCPLEYIHSPIVPYESIPVNVSHSDFNLESYSQTIIGFESQILLTIAQAKRRYGSILVFCADVQQAERLASIVKRSVCITGKTPNKERARIIESFKKGDTQTVFNVGCLAVGFDHPALDCIVLLRPVRSPILYLQMLGRLTRPYPGKSCGTVIDLTGSCKALGSVESFEVYCENGWAWNVRSEKVPDGFHGKLLFKMHVQR